MNNYERAKMVLVPIWRGIPVDYKRRYARNVWQQFEDNVRSAAYTNSLSKFFNRICSRLQVAIRADDVKGVNDILASGQDKDILRLMRDEATTIVLMVRVENDARKAEWEANHAADEAALNQWLTEQPEIS